MTSPLSEYATDGSTDNENASELDQHLVPTNIRAPSMHWIYALGQVEPRFRSIAIEKEYAQVLGRSNTQGMTDKQAFESILTKRANRYLVRNMCWVFTVEGIESYLLMPRESPDYLLLTESIRQRPEPGDIDVIIGSLGPLAPPEACGLTIPIVYFDQIYSFNRTDLLDAIPTPAGFDDNQKKDFMLSAGELLDRILQLADNAGATDEHRALNYLAMRYPAIYLQTVRAYADNSSLIAVEVIPSRLRGIRNVLDVIFSFRNRETDVVYKYFVRVDVTEQFPFLVSKLTPYFDR